MGVEYFVTSIVVILLPGTGVLYTLAIALGRGFKPSIAAALGCTLGILPAAIASIVGLAAILHTSALAFQAIKYLGVAYLFYMAWNIMRDGGTFDVSENKQLTSTQNYNEWHAAQCVKSKTFAILHGISTAIRTPQCRWCNDDIDCSGGHFYDADIRCFRWIWRMCRPSSGLRHISPNCNDLDETAVCGNVWVFGFEIGFVRLIAVQFHPDFGRSHHKFCFSSQSAMA